MIDNKCKNKLYCLTLLLDIVLLFILCNYKLNCFDFIYCISLLISHALFFYGLIYYNKKLLDCLHIAIFIYVLLSIFLQNKYLIGLCLFFTLTLQVLWIIENKCILNEGNENWGMSKSISLLTLLINTILAYKLGNIIS
tara:strand:- start:21 stop:437 length:417 start_codon:yes stop_codon:yes gene_type:complete